MNKTFIVSLLLLVMMSLTNHPLLLTTTDITVKDGVVSGKTKLFTDDVEMTLRSYCNTPSIDLINKGLDKPAQECLKKHFTDNFIIYNGTKKIEYQIKNISFKEGRNDVIIVEFSTKKFEKRKTPEYNIHNTLLFTYIPEQKNIINFSTSSSTSEPSIVTFENESNDKVKIVK